jgi:hypothetical protein
VPERSLKSFEHKSRISAWNSSGNYVFSFPNKENTVDGERETHQTAHPGQLRRNLIFKGPVREKTGDENRRQYENDMEAFQGHNVMIPFGGLVL